MDTRYRQTFTVTLVTRNERPRWVLSDALQSHPAVEDGFHLDWEESAEELPGLNRARLIELAQWVAAEHAKKELGLPSEWNQNSWLTKRAGVNSCGTTCCVAGKVAIDDGGRPAIARDGWNDWDEIPESYDFSRVTFPGRPDRDVYVREYAQKTLGLTDEQADMLFDSNNDLDDILRTIKEILDATPGEDETSAPPVPEVTARRPRAGITYDPCVSDTCDLCYEDVPADEVAVTPANEDALF